MTARPPAGPRAALAILCAAALGLAGCARWSETRSRVVDPLHQLLHRTYAAVYKQGDRVALEALFDGPEAAAPSLALFDAFGEVQDAHSDIHYVRLEERPVRARIELRLDGVGPSGALRSVHQVHEFQLARVEEGWRIVGDRPEALRETPTPTAFFYEEAKLRGLWFEHLAKPTPGPDGDPKRYVFGSGIAAADVDGNGFDDLVLASGARIELFLNQGGWFDRVSEAWGLGAQLEAPGDTQWTVLLPRDFDGDGRRDLLVAAEFGQPHLLHNDGTRFREIPDSGIHSEERTIGAVAADFDGDGNLDLYLANHESVYRVAPDLPFARNARPDQLFLGTGDGHFRDAGREAGIDNTGWSLAPVAADYDGDGDVDLFVGNDFGYDTLLANDGRGHFHEVTAAAGLDVPVAAMGADWGDYDGDGDFDLFVTGMASGSGWVLEVPDFEIRRVPWIVDVLFRPYVRQAVRAWFEGNRLYENLGDGTFHEHGAESGARRNGWGWGAVWLDFDNDGRLDVYAPNGFLSGPLLDDL